MEGNIEIYGKDLSQGQVHLEMPGNVFHVMVMGEQSIDIASIGISDNFRNAVLAEPTFAEIFFWVHPRRVRRMKVESMLVR